MLVYTGTTGNNYRLRGRDNEDKTDWWVACIRMSPVTATSGWLRDNKRCCCLEQTQGWLITWGSGDLPWILWGCEQSAVFVMFAIFILTDLLRSAVLTFVYGTYCEQETLISVLNFLYFLFFIFLRRRRDCCKFSQLYAAQQNNRYLSCPSPFWHWGI